MSYCVNGFRVDTGHDRAPFVLVVVAALFMVPFLFIFSKLSKRLWSDLWFSFKC